jgi:hypothetical protein
MEQLEEYIYPDGSVELCLTGLRHNRRGPAYISSDGTREWFFLGLRHRTNGPAVISLDNRIQWWLDGHNYTFEHWLDLTPINEEEKLLLKLIYS